jgi:CDP-6-deoxy-D-xylo-4-hexulose-3-dehydrase
LTAGRYADQFEENLAKYLGVRYCSLTNSGSSANLLAISALTSPKVGERRIRKGDEVITVAASFPTTIAPNVQHGAVPVFVDIDFPTYNVDCSQLDDALSSRTKAVMLAHTLGNPFDLQTVRDFCDRHGLWLIEDNCDALGAQYFYNGEWRYTGTIGDLGTSSFYPPHHITTGEGGAVYTNNPLLKQLVDSFRDWGRDCTCPPGRDNTCNRRFSQQFGSLPKGYDHKYVYSHLGYNLKMTDLQAAIGCAQLAKLPAFIEARNRNWQLLREGLDNLSDYFIFPEPAPNSKPSWFGFLITVKDNTGFCRNEIVNFLEYKNVQTRMLFAGNMPRQPCFNDMIMTDEGYRTLGDLTTTNKLMDRSFWIGIYPGLSFDMLNFIVKTINDFILVVHK